MAKKPKLLVVDDDAAVRNLLAEKYKNTHEVLCADSGASALELALSESPHVIVLDAMMPEMDGYEVCRRLRADGRTNLIHVIMLSAKTGFAAKADGMVSGADCYLTKPIDFDWLSSRIAMYAGGAF